MKRIIFVLFFTSLFIKDYSQARDVNKLTLEKTYSMVEIHKSLRELIYQAESSSYFNDDFFNALLKKIVTDKQFSEKEKVQLFYLMQKKIGYAFVGLEFLPPKLNYFQHHSGKVFIYQKTKASLKDLSYNVAGLLTLVDSNGGKDVILASNALLLATLLNSDTVIKKLEQYTKADYILFSNNAGIFNHYVCMSASILQNATIENNLIKNLTAFTQGELIEDVLCALYSNKQPVITIKDYVLAENNSLNYLAIETALCALAAQVPPASFQQSVKSLIASSKDKWKTDLFKKILDNKIPYNYSLTSKDQLVTKLWDSVTITAYHDGTLIMNGGIMEFDAN